MTSGHGLTRGEKVLSYKEGNEAYDNGVKMGRYLQKQIEYLKSWCPVCLNRECRCNQVAKRKIEELLEIGAVNSSETINDLLDELDIRLDQGGE